jgi:hypothetical protein
MTMMEVMRCMLWWQVMMMTGAHQCDASDVDHLALPSLVIDAFETDSRKNE